MKVRKSKRSKSSNNDRCIVSDCMSRADRNLNLSFHRFPKPNDLFVRAENAFGNLEKMDKLDAWKVALKVSDITPRSKVCSLHFKKYDFILPDFVSQRKRLKRSAVPSCNLPGSSERKMISSQAQSEKHTNWNDTSPTIKVIKEEPEISEIIDIKHEIDIEECEYKDNFNFQEENATDSNNIEIFVKASSSAQLFRDIGVQVNTVDVKKSSFCDNITSDSELHTATGIESFKVLDTIVSLMKLVDGDKFERNCAKMNTRKRLIMTYVKLRQNLSYSLLAIMFNTYSAKHCQRVFFETIRKLSYCFKTTLPSHINNEISRHMSGRRVKNFKILESVMPVTLVPIQKDISIVISATINLCLTISSDSELSET